MRELWYEFLEWYQANGINEILTWAIGIFVTILTAVAKISSNKSKVREIRSVADNKSLKEQNEKQIQTIKQENEALKGEICDLKGNVSELKITVEKLVAMNYQILISARVDEKVKTIAGKIMNYDVKSVEQAKVKEAVNNVLEEVIETAKEDIKNKNVAGEFDPLLDVLLNNAKGRFGNE